MGQDRGLLFPTQRLSSLSSLALSHLEKQDLNLISKTSGDITNMLYTLGSYPVSTQLSLSHFDGSHGWVHGSSYPQQQFLPPQKPCMMKQMPLKVDGVISKAEGQCSQKRFLVFDQSGDKTTLLLASDIRKSFETLKQPACPDMKEELQRNNKDLFVCQGMQGHSEDLQEDTEELNALLYSEDESDYCSEEDEVTSSGHSPSTVVSSHGDKETFLGSYGQPLHAKKRKALENMRDAESSCGSCGNTRIGFLKRSKPSNNKIREEKIFETVSLLRSIVPGEELVDPILVIDRAIDYLKSLKMEAVNRGYGTHSLQDI